MLHASPILGCCSRQTMPEGDSAILPGLAEGTIGKILAKIRRLLYECYIRNNRAKGHTVLEKS